MEGAVDLKIAMVGTDLGALDSSVGALEKLCLGWVKILKEYGAYVSLFSIKKPGNEIELENGLFHFASTQELVAKLSIFDPDIVIANNRPMWDLNAKIGKINIFHNYPDAWALPEQTSRSSLSNALQGCLNLAVSKTLALYVQKQYSVENIGVLYPFIEQSFFDATPNNRNVSDRRSIKVLFSNRTLEKKGLRWTIETIDEYLPGKVELTVVRNISPWTSETDEHSTLLALARSRSYVSVIEKVVSTESLIDLYSDHDIVVTPSVKEEGLGLIPLEAQALGVPVVTTNVGGLSESTFAPNLCITPNDSALFANAIFEGLRIPLHSRNAIRETVSQMFSPKSSGDQLIGAIESLLNRNGLG